jgi:hypothetical protein
MSTDARTESESADQFAVDEQLIEKTIAQYWDEEIERALDETGEALVVELRHKVWARLDERSRREFLVWAAHRRELPFPWPCPSDAVNVQDWFNPSTGLYARTVSPIDD